VPDSKTHIALYSTEIDVLSGEGAVKLYYKGAFEEVMLSNLFYSLKGNEVDVSRAAKRLFAVCVEVAQNIARHSVERSIVENSIFNDIGIGTIMIIEKIDRYCVVSANKVSTPQALQLKDYVLKISHTDAEGLRLMKRDLLARPLEANQKSGRIGLIQIALKSDFPLQCYCTEIDSQLSYYTLRADVKKNLD
jgi:hypothetical protein